MKFILMSLITTAILTTSITTTACTFNDSGSDGIQPSPKPPTPQPHNLKYWQNLKCQNQTNSQTCNEMLQEIKNQQAHYDHQDQYQCALDEVTAEQYFYQSIINNCDYQILLCQKVGNFTPIQTALAIKTLTTAINNLKQELTLKVKYPNDYRQAALADISKQITDTQTILNNFLKPS